MATTNECGRLISVVHGPASRAMIRQDWAWVSGWLNGRFGVDVSAGWVAENLPRSRGAGYIDRGYSDGSWAAWFKSKIRDQGLLRTEFVGCDFGGLLVPLHVGFLSLEESPEHLARLRAEDKTPLKNGPDTPGIERREAPLGPINRTAARVLPTPPAEGG